MNFGLFPSVLQVLAFAFLCFPQSFALYEWLRFKDGPSDMGLLPLVSGELWPVWFFFGSWCRELSQGILWPARFLLSAESACAEVGGLPPNFLLSISWTCLFRKSFQLKQKNFVVYARGIFMEVMVGFLPWQGNVCGCCCWASEPGHSILFFLRLSFCPLFWTGA